MKTADMNRADDSFKLYDGWSYWVVRMGKTMQQDLAARLERYGLNDRKLAVLMSIETSAKDTPSAIADYMGVDRAVVARTLKEFHADDLISLHPNIEDGRSHKVSLTEKGRQKFQQGTICAREMNEYFAAKLNPGQAETIRKDFRGIVETENSTIDDKPLADLLGRDRGD